MFCLDWLREETKEIKEQELRNGLLNLLNSVCNYGLNVFWFGLTYGWLFVVVFCWLFINNGLVYGLSTVFTFMWNFWILQYCWGFRVFSCK